MSQDITMRGDDGNLYSFESIRAQGRLEGQVVGVKKAADFVKKVAMEYFEDGQDERATLLRNLSELMSDKILPPLEAVVQKRIERRVREQEREFPEVVQLGTIFTGRRPRIRHQHAVERTPRKVQPWIEEGWLRKKCKDGVAQRQIAKEAGCSRKTIFRARKRFGIKTRSEKRRDVSAWIDKEVRARMTGEGGGIEVENKSPRN
jgi:hypothetical protein